MIDPISLVMAVVIAESKPEFENCKIYEETKVICELIEGEPNYKFGNTTLKVLDPLKLLEEAKKTSNGSFNEISLWNVYGYPPFIKELARQNQITPQQLIDTLAAEEVEPNPWRSLKEMARIYPEARRVYGPEVVNPAFKTIMDQVINDVLKQLGLSLEHEGV